MIEQIGNFGRKIDMGRKMNDPDGALDPWSFSGGTWWNTSFLGFATCMLCFMDNSAKVGNCYLLKWITYITFAVIY